jgi:hypothetical protein
MASFLFAPVDSNATKTLDPSVSVFGILPGKLHKGGTLTATPSETDIPGMIRILIDYEITKKTLVPVPSAYLTGNYAQVLPEEFLKEDGYLALEQAGAIEAQDSTVIHQGRVPFRNLGNAHLIQIIPNNGKFEIHLVYHPSIPGLGWDEVKLILHTGIPLLGNYWIEGTLSEPSVDH